MHEKAPDKQWLVQAYRFLYAARTLLNSKEYSASRALFTPTLHLTAHGIELLLKSNLIGSGLSEADMKNQIRHDIQLLWDHELNSELRNEIEEAAVLVWDHARLNPRFQGEFGSDPRKELKEYLRVLSSLHAQTSGDTIRYMSAPDAEGPRPHLMIEAFFTLADRKLRQLLHS